jgi:CheY-like chemotaxis protein
MIQKEIFLVDDSPDFRQMVRTIFARYLPEYHLKFFQGGEELYKYMILQSDEEYKGRRPVLIILNLKMSNIHGLELLKMLRHTPSNLQTHWKSIPIVMLSRMATQEEIDTCYAAGASSFLIKPLDSKKLKHLLTNICHYWVDHNHLAAAPCSIMSQQ